MEQARITLMIVATGDYIKYLDNLLESCDKYFMKDCDVTYHVFTNKREETMLDKYNHIVFHYVKHKPFPYPTLYRYHFMKEHQQELQGADYYFYLDVDTVVKDDITSEVLGERVATQHCGFVGEIGSYETNKLSTSYVDTDFFLFKDTNKYYGGAFWGFSYREFWKFIYTATYMIDVDKDNDIIPVWHDESVLNRYLIDNPPTKILSPSYHYPEDLEYYKAKWDKLGLKFNCKILLLDKNREV